MLNTKIIGMHYKAPTGNHYRVTDVTPHEDDGTSFGPLSRISAVDINTQDDVPPVYFRGTVSEFEVFFDISFADEVEASLAEDLVNHPAHYTQGQYEVIDVIEDWKLEHHEANAVKYVARAKHKKNRIQDLEKAVWYLQRKIKLLS